MDDISELILTVARAPDDGRDHKDCIPVGYANKAATTNRR